jgi:hypothetical protein
VIITEFCNAWIAHLLGKHQLPKISARSKIFYCKKIEQSGFSTTSNFLKQDV